MRSFNIRRIAAAALLTLPALTLGVSAAYAEDLMFTLNNNSSRVLTEFHVEDAASKTWGSDILHRDILPGESATVTIADGKRTCMYDIRGAFRDGTVTEDGSLNLCELGSYTYHD